MNIRAIVLVSLVGASAPTLLYASKNSKTAQNIVNCGRGAVCSVQGIFSFSAIGDTRSFDISALTAIDLGRITKNNTVKDITLPREKDSMLLYTYTPTDGTLKDKIVYALLYNIARLPDANNKYGTDIRVFAHLDPSSGSDWTEVAIIQLPQKELSQDDSISSLTLQPDGTAEWENKADNTKEIFQLEVMLQNQQTTAKAPHSSASAPAA